MTSRHQRPASPTTATNSSSSGGSDTQQPRLSWRSLQAILPTRRSGFSIALCAAPTRCTLRQAEESSVSLRQVVKVAGVSLWALFREKKVRTVACLAGHERAVLASSLQIGLLSLSTKVGLGSVGHEPCLGLSQEKPRN